MGTTDPRVERLRAVAASSNLRSPLGQWFGEHRSEFAAMLAEYRPRWETLVEHFATEGLLTLPADWQAEDETVRKTARRRVVKAAMRTWERANAKGQTTTGVPPVKSTPAHPRQGTTTQSASGSTPTKTPDIRSLLSTGRKIPDPINE